MKRKEKPRKNSPQDFRLLFPENIRGILIPIKGNAKILISTLNPNREIIHAVTVVPTFAPMITPMDWASESRPAFTKLTTITVVALDD